MNALFALLLAAFLPTEWQHVQEMPVPQAGLVRLSLPAATLDAARPGLEDLRIVDTAGNEVPYLIIRPTRCLATVLTPKKFNVRIVGTTTIITIDTGGKHPLEAVTLDTPAEGFIKAVTIEGSNDQVQWKPLASGQPIFRQGNGVANYRVAFPEGNWPFLRVTVDDKRTEAIPFTGARLHGITEELTAAEPVPLTITDRTENDGQTRLTLDLGAAHLTLASLRIGTDEPLFSRAVSVATRQVAENTVSEQVLARDTVYRVEVEGQTATARVAISLDVTVPGREVLLLIENQDSPPLTIKSVEIHHWPVDVLFLAAQAGSFRVFTGNLRCVAPHYDLAGLQKTLAIAPLRRTLTKTLETLTSNPSYHPAEPLPEVQDLGTALDTAAWSCRKAVKTTRDGVQQLDLDLDVLSKAQANFGDLRLMRDSKQRPFVMERSSIARKLAPEVSTATDPKRPTVSRWKLKLPLVNLPVTRLTCTSLSPLFRRQIALFEEAKDERGEQYRRHLGGAAWVRTSTAAKATLELRLVTQPMTDTLILETDNRDNPAIELANVQLFYPVTRLWFKTPQKTETFLYYGNREASFPQYDLELVAPRLLAEEKSVAVLGPEESLKRAGVGELFALSSTKNVLFWAVLGLVVVVLLVVIARLLPKPPAAS